MYFFCLATFYAHQNVETVVFMPFNYMFFISMHTDILISFGSLASCCILPRDYHHTIHLETCKTYLHENTKKEYYTCYPLGYNK